MDYQLKTMFPCHITFFNTGSCVPNVLLESLNTFSVFLISSDNSHCSLVTAPICLCASVICCSLCLAAGTMEWNQGRLLMSSCLCTHTWWGRRFFVWCLLGCLAFDSRQWRRRLLANGPAGFNVRLIDKVTRVFKPFLVIIWLCDDSIHKTTGCLWCVYRVFRAVDSFLVSNEKWRFGKGFVTLTAFKSPLPQVFCRTCDKMFSPLIMRG